MRRAVLLGAATLLVAAAGVFAVLIPPVASHPAAAHITRLFIPAIKVHCREHAFVDENADIGYTFTDFGALVTIDHDGSRTGLLPQTLERLNACLAEYPIEPITELPRDHYSRNLLYDYFSQTLEPCLAGRVDEVPPLPARSDFVVRLYIWDPYRAIAPGLTLDRLLTLATACPALPPYLSPPVSAADTVTALQPTWLAQADCFAIAGLPTDPSQSWAIVGPKVNVYDASGGVIATFDTGAPGPAGNGLLECLGALEH